MAEELDDVPELRLTDPAAVGFRFKSIGLLPFASHCFTALIDPGASQATVFRHRIYLLVQRPEFLPNGPGNVEIAATSYVAIGAQACDASYLNEIVGSKFL